MERGHHPSSLIKSAANNIRNHASSKVKHPNKIRNRASERGSMPNNALSSLLSGPRGAGHSNSSNTTKHVIVVHEFSQSCLSAGLQCIVYVRIQCSSATACCCCFRHDGLSYASFIPHALLIPPLPLPPPLLALQVHFESIAPPSAADRNSRHKGYEPQETTHSIFLTSIFKHYRAGIF